MRNNEFRRGVDGEFVVSLDYDYGVFNDVKYLDDYLVGGFCYFFDSSVVSFIWSSIIGAKNFILKSILSSI